MARPLKYLPGEVITDPIDAVREILAGRYIIEFDKRQHPAWAAGYSLNLIRAAVKARRLRFAIPNPEHPDNKEPSQ